MDKKIIGLILVAVLIVYGAYFWKTKNNPKSTNTSNPIEAATNTVTPTKDGSEIVLYFGDTCPHCKIVEEFLLTNKIAEKVLFTEKEVFNNTANAKELSEKATICGMPADSIGVPFLWDGQKCYSGQVEVTDFFKQKAGI